MKRLLSIITMIALALMCQRVSVHAQETGKSMAVQFLEANDGLKGAKCMKLDGLMLRMARPTLKKTPVIAIMDDLESFYMFSFKENREAEEKAFVTSAQKMLKSYMKVSEITDDISHMVIYVDQPNGSTCNEIVMLVTWPSTSMMVFHGVFTEDSLRRMDEISKKQRAEKSDFHKGIYRNSQLPD